MIDEKLNAAIEAALTAMRITDVELVILAPRLSAPYAKNIDACIHQLRAATTQLNNAAVLARMDER